MPKAAILGSISTGHNGFNPRPSIEGSPNVKVEGKPAMRLGDAWATHTDNNSTHDGVSSSGSSTVFVNGKPKCRIGDAISCGDTIATGASTVNVG